jgi:phosphoribosylglycinamide formyltransferase-1
MQQIPAKNLLLFASGSGSNVENIARHFASDPRVSIRGVFCNNPKAGVIERCQRLGLPLYCFNRVAFEDTDGLLRVLQCLKPDLIVLAGFLWKIPEHLVAAFPGKIINIHPALLPKFGGKGMYGMHVHQAVVNSGERETGITIHYVNEAYDQGAVIIQKKVALDPSDSPDAVAGKVHVLEYEHYPVVVESLLFP